MAGRHRTAAQVPATKVTLGMWTTNTLTAPGPWVVVPPPDCKKAAVKERAHVFAGKLIPSQSPDNSVTLSTFEEYFVPSINEWRAAVGKDDEWVLVLIDPAGVHMSLRAFLDCCRNKIDVLLLPAHASHWLQPVDVFGARKVKGRAGAVRPQALKRGARAGKAQAQSADTAAVLGHYAYNIRAVSKCAQAPTHTKHTRLAHSQHCHRRRSTLPATAAAGPRWACTRLTPQSCPTAASCRTVCAPCWRRRASPKPSRRTRAR